MHLFSGRRKELFEDFFSKSYKWLIELVHRIEKFIYFFSLELLKFQSFSFEAKQDRNFFQFDFCQIELFQKYFRALCQEDKTKLPLFLIWIFFIVKNFWKKHFYLTIGLCFPLYLMINKIGSRTATWGVTSIEKY